MTNHSCAFRYNVFYRVAVCTQAHGSHANAHKQAEFGDPSQFLMEAKRMNDMGASSELNMPRLNNVFDTMPQPDIDLFSSRQVQAMRVRLVCVWMCVCVDVKYTNADYVNMNLFVCLCVCVCGRC